VALEVTLVLKVMLHKVNKDAFPDIFSELILLRPVFVSVAALAILDRLDEVDIPMLAWWLSERQLPNGGLNGRPEKLEDVR